MAATKGSATHAKQRGSRGTTQQLRVVAQALHKTDRAARIIWECDPGRPVEQKQQILTVAILAQGTH